MEINIQNFKQLYTANLSTFNINSLQHYLEEGEKIMCNMIAVDPVVVEIVSKLSEEIKTRG